jgi:hypothetical protein
MIIPNFGVGQWRFNARYLITAIIEHITAQAHCSARYQIAATDAESHVISLTRRITSLAATPGKLSIRRWFVGGDFRGPQGD